MIVQNGGHQGEVDAERLDEQGPAKTVVEIMAEPDGPDDGGGVVDQGDDGRRCVFHITEAEPDVDHDGEYGQQRSHEGFALGVAGDLRIKIADALELGLATDALVGQPPHRAGDAVTPGVGVFAVEKIRLLYENHRFFRRYSFGVLRSRRLARGIERDDFVFESAEVGFRRRRGGTVDAIADLVGANGRRDILQDDRRPTDVCRGARHCFVVDFQRVFPNGEDELVEDRPDLGLTRRLRPFEFAGQLDLQIIPHRRQHRLAYFGGFVVGRHHFVEIQAVIERHDAGAGDRRFRGQPLKHILLRDVPRISTIWASCC